VPSRRRHDRDGGEADRDDGTPALPERAVRRFDALHNEHVVLGYPVAVIRKYADDRGSAFAALMTHYAFLALFPLVVLMLTVLDHVAAGDEAFRERIVDSVSEQLPVIGEMLQDEAEPLAVGSVLVVLSIAGLLWGATGMYNSAQLGMSQIWNVEGVERPGFVGRLWRSLALFATLGAGVLVSAAAWWSGLFVPPTVAIHATSVVGVVLLNAVFLLIGLRIVTPPTIRTRHLLLPAVVSGVAWEVLRFLGQWIVVRQLEQQDQLYGIFAAVLVTIAWLDLVARGVVLGVQASVVWVNDLWPRRLAQPPFTEADREALDRIVRNEHRRPEQRIEISWDLDEDQVASTSSSAESSRSTSSDDV
jgi:YihY family inner membrane protein